MNMNQKRVWVILLAIAFLVGAIAISSFAAQATSGACCQKGTTIHAQSSCPMMTASKTKTATVKCACCGKCVKCTCCAKCGSGQKNCKSCTTCCKGGKCQSKGTSCCAKGSKCGKSCSSAPKSKPAAKPKAPAAKTPKK